MRHLPASSYQVMPWKNGGGITTQIHIGGEDPVAYDWRASIATVAADGPFSRFPGYDRHIMTIEGDGMVLEGGPDGDIDVSPAFVPRRFSGDWNITGHLRGGVSRDFNLIVRQSEFESDMDVMQLTAPATFDAARGWLLLHALTGDGRFAGQPLGQSDSLLLEPDERVRLDPISGSLLLAVCRIRKRIDQ